MIESSNFEKFLRYSTQIDILSSSVRNTKFSPSNPREPNIMIFSIIGVVAHTMDNNGYEKYNKVHKCINPCAHFNVKFAL
ncbi:hypothetical protein BpHYR1_038892 [Brachionus plicatilis]|uniref:Uncharacterized protein n=1 Tax=Brachionus plicatilis TaxID=10195 RepID=A0A3M7PKN4_BRAPC|nr:hypothetical protein BpHYR1_038892 [Brachionus plicatilis]